MLQYTVHVFLIIKFPTQCNPRRLSDCIICVKIQFFYLLCKVFYIFIQDNIFNIYIVIHVLYYDRQMFLTQTLVDRKNIKFDLLIYLVQWNATIDLFVCLLIDNTTATSVFFPLDPLRTLGSATITLIGIPPMTCD